MATQQTERSGLDEWKQRIEELYESIRGWAREMDPVPCFEFEEIAIVEKWSGEYRIAELKLRQGQAEMVIRPIARDVLGADGRVDLLGLDGPFTLFLHQAEESDDFRDEDGRERMTRGWKSRWYWVQDRPPWESVPLDGPLFRDLAESCLR